MWICGAFVYQAGHTTSATNIALLYAVAPVAITAVSLRLLGERMAAAQRVGVALALSGVVFIIAKGDLDNLLAVRLAVGDAWALVAAACWVAYSVLLKHWPSTLSPAVRLAAIIAGGLLVLAPFTLAEALWVEATVWSLPGLGLVVAGAVLPGVLSYTAYSYLQRELGASRTALLLYLSPVYGALGAWGVLGEPPGWYHAAGAALILPSIWLATRPARR
jgi:drug/metabolite transporter (DMT)-like permease